MQGRTETITYLLVITVIIAFMVSFELFNQELNGPVSYGSGGAVERDVSDSFYNNYNGYGEISEMTKEPDDITSEIIQPDNTTDAVDLINGTSGNLTVLINETYNTTENTTKNEMIIIDNSTDENSTINNSTEDNSTAQFNGTSTMSPFSSRSAGNETITANTTNATIAANVTVCGNNVVEIGETCAVCPQDVKCDFVCYEGRCIEPSCMQDSDCNNDSTLDVCLNASTPFASCQNSIIRESENETTENTGNASSGDAMQEPENVVQPPDETISNDAVDNIETPVSSTRSEQARTPVCGDYLCEENDCAEDCREIDSPKISIITPEKIDPGESFSIKVISDSGTPIEGAAVTYAGEQKTTDSDGLVQFIGERQGNVVKIQYGGDVESKIIKLGGVLNEPGYELPRFLTEGILIFLTVSFIVILVYMVISRSIERQEMGS